MGTWEHGNVGAWKCGSVGTWEHGNMGAWECGSVGAWEHRNMGAWKHGSVETWEHGNVRVWVQGYRFFTAVCLLAKVGKNAQSSLTLEKRKNNVYIVY